MVRKTFIAATCVLGLTLPGLASADDTVSLTENQLDRITAGTLVDVESIAAVALALAQGAAPLSFMMLQAVEHQVENAIGEAAETTADSTTPASVSSSTSSSSG